MVTQLPVVSDPQIAPSNIALRSQIPVNNAPPTDQSLHELADKEALADQCDRSNYSGGSRWPREETLTLLKLRSDMDTSFRNATLKGPVWEELSRKLADMGYHRDAKKCKEKFENVHKYYKRTKHGKVGKSYRFFTQLEALYGNTAGAYNCANAIEAKAVEKNNGGRIAIAVGGETNNPHDEGQKIKPVDTRSTPIINDRLREVNGSESYYGNGLNITSSSSSSSDDDYEVLNGNLDSQEGQRKRKRKRKWQRRLLVYFEKLMDKVISKQEKMHEALLEALERREEERMVREEARKRQEMATMQREQEAREEEGRRAAIRDAALVEFFERAIGRRLELPSSIAMRGGSLIMELHKNDKDDEVGDPLCRNHNSKTNNNIKNHNIINNINNNSSDNNNRWPKMEVQLLIKLRADLHPRFVEQSGNCKNQIWEEISASMAKHGFQRSSKRCKEKWENINKYFRKKVNTSAARGRKTVQNSKTCPYFEQLDSLYRDGVLGSSAGAADNSTIIMNDTLNVEDHANVQELDNNSQSTQEGDAIDVNLRRISAPSNGTDHSPCNSDQEIIATDSIPPSETMLQSPNNIRTNSDVQQSQTTVATHAQIQSPSLVLKSPTLPINTHSFPGEIQQLNSHQIAQQHIS